MSRYRLLLLIVPVFALALLAGCMSDDSSSGEQTAVATSCDFADLKTYKDGFLTIATDSPAYPPYFEDDNPSNGKGFESALAYAIADEMGFEKDGIEWAKVPFNAAYAPGEKKFDFDLNQISIKPSREKAVDFSVPYYTASQGVLVGKGSDLEGITSIDGLKDATIGVQIGTTSLDAVEDEIQPSTDPKVFDNSNDVVSALNQGQVDAIVVDLPQAIYLRDAIVSGSSVVGQFDAPGGDQWGAVLDKGSQMTACVSQAIENLEDDGTLEEITDKWMSGAADAPKLN